MLAQSRPGAKGGLFFHAAIPPSEFGSDWPPGVPLQIHMMDADELALRDGDLAVARQLAATIDDAELFLYAGDRHLFADRGLPDYDEHAARALKRRVLAFLDSVGRRGNA
jgi:dienelactone hydrolase